EFADLLVVGLGRQRRLLAQQGVALLAQLLVLVRHLLLEFVALLLDLLAHHLGRLGVLQQRLDIDDENVERRRRGGRGRLLRLGRGQQRPQRSNKQQWGKTPRQERHQNLVPKLT